jgi:hypothetical protein
MGKGIQFSEADKDGVNRDRLEIIDIIRQLYADDSSKSIPEILIRLAFDKLPTDDKSIGKSKTIVNRILQFDVHNRKGDSISGIRVTDLLLKFKEKFPGYPKANANITDDISSTHSDVYIYYYESYSEIKEEFFIKFALVGFDLNNATQEWDSGDIYYLSEDYRVNKKFILSRVIPQEINRKALFFYAQYQDQINFFTLLVNNKPRESRGIIPLTYSVIETQNRVPCAGKGLLEKIEKNIPERINEIIKAGISNPIINALYQRKIILNDVVYKKLNDFTTHQMESLKNLEGIWSGIHFRTDFDEAYSIPEKGGICKFILSIQGSGECKLVWGKEKNELKSYSGFIECPFNAISFLKIYLEFLKKEETYKLYLFLSLGSKSEKGFSYKGVISGWMNNNKRIFTSPIYMVKVDEGKTKVKKDIEMVLEEFPPKRISKTHKDEIDNIDPMYIEALKKIESEHLATFSNCMLP